MNKESWTERVKCQYHNIEKWKQTMGVYIIELINSNVESEIYYYKLQKLFHVSTWDEAYTFFDKEILEQIILMAFENESSVDNSYEVLIKEYSAQYIYCKFIEYYIDNQQSLITGLISLYVLDKLGLLKENIDVQYL